MQREKIQLIRDGLETAYVNGNTASELLYKPNFVSNNHNEGKGFIGHWGRTFKMWQIPNQCCVYYAGRGDAAAPDIKRIREKRNPRWDFNL